MGTQLPLIDPNPPELTGDPDDLEAVELTNWPTDGELAAIGRLVAIGHGHSGQCVYVRQFMLAWWNAGENGGFDIANLFCVDTEIARDMVAVFAMVARVMAYPDGCERLPDLRRDMEAFIDRAPKKRQRRAPTKPRTPSKRTPSCGHPSTDMVHTAFGQPWCKSCGAPPKQRSKRGRASR